MTETKSKPSVKKAAVSETTAKKTAPKTRTKKTTNVISNQERYELIQRTAYFIAEHNGFVGDPHAFWAEAEAQISKMKS
jgi:2-polyprenyl-3-methyl-5-hydroxy-6-metoxy-1,4-benzoquinol methylase